MSSVDGEDICNASCDLFDDDDVNAALSQSQDSLASDCLDCAFTCQTSSRTDKAPLTKGADDLKATIGTDDEFLKVKPDASSLSIQNLKYEDTSLTAFSENLNKSLAGGREDSESNDFCDIEHPCKRHKIQDHDSSRTFCNESGSEVSSKDHIKSLFCVREQCTSVVEDSEKGVVQASLSPNSNSVQKSFASGALDQDMSDETLKQRNSEVLLQLTHTAQGEENRSSLTCPFCHVQESCLLLLENHITTAHPDTSEQESEDLCNAGATFSGVFQFVCPLCDVDLESGPDLATHMTAVHGEESHHSAGMTDHLSCPLCDFSCVSEEDMSRHVSSHESDSIYYGVGANAADPRTASVPDLCPDLVCPMCGQMMGDSDLLTSHVESHFSPQHCSGGSMEASQPVALNKENIPLRKPSTSDGSAKYKASTSTSTSSSSSSSRGAASVPAPSRGQAEGSPLSARDVSNYRRQYEQSLEKAVMRGQMSVADFHEQRASLQGSDLVGVDDGHSRVDGLIELLERLYRQQARPGQRAHLCSPTSHFSGSHGDRGWGCGYRNFQMMLSCLASQLEYTERVFKDGRVVIPSIPKVQQMIESAWHKGFDEDGCRQLKGRLVNTQKWIGATEIVATLSSLGVRCRLADFHAPSAPDGTHPRLVEWVTDYFTNRSRQFTPPLYLQHQGHSRTIIGVEIDRDTTRLLLFDPGSKRDHIATLASAGLSWKSMRTFRRNQAAFKAKQYQIVAVVGLLTDREIEESKIIKSERIS